jgi:hypothetical protein
VPYPATNVVIIEERSAPVNKAFQDVEAVHQTKPKRPQTTAELLEAALQSANSHEAQPLPRSHMKRRPRMFTRFRTI